MFILPKEVIREMEDNNTYRCVWTCTTCVCTEEIAGKQFGGKKRYLKIRKNFLDYLIFKRHYDLQWNRDAWRSPNDLLSA